MRRRDKSKNIDRANVLAEQRYLKSKGLLTEGTESTNWDEVLTRNLTDPSSDLFTFDFNGKRTTLRVTRVNKISFDNIKFLHIDVQLEPNNIVGDTQTIVVGKNAKDVFLPSKGNTGELELVGNSKSWLSAVRQNMLKQESQQQDDTINESGMAHAAGFADGGSGFEEGATMMQDNGDVLKESIYTLQDFIDLVFNKDKELGQRYFNRMKTNPKDFPNVANSAKELKFIDKGFLKKIGVYNDTEIDKILNFLDVDVLKESPWNGDPNSNWVPGDDDIEVEVHEWSLDFERTEDTDKYPDDHILVSVNAASGGQQWNTEVELSSFIPRKEGEKYAPLVQRLINLNGGKDYKVSDDQLFKNPKTKEIANILDGLISDFADSYEVDYDDPYPDEDLMPGGKYDRMDEGAVNKSGIKKSSKRIKITESQRRLLKSKGLITEDEGSQGGNSMERLRQALIKLSPDFGNAIFTDATGFIGHPWSDQKMMSTSNNGAIAVVDEKGHYHCFPCKGYIRGHHNQISNSDAFRMVQQAAGEAGFVTGSIGVKCGSGNKHGMD